MSDFKPILALETAFDTVSLCLYDGDVVDFMCELAPRKQTERVLPMLDDLLQKNSLTLPDLGALAFNRGPGSFSGIRINTAVVQALGFAHGLPCVGVSSLVATAQAAFEADADLTVVNVAIDARMNEVYFARFVREGIEGLPQIQGAEQLLGYTHDFSNLAGLAGVENTTPASSSVWAGDGVSQLEHLPKNAQVSVLNESISAKSTLKEGALKENALEAGAKMSAKHIAQLAWQDYIRGNTVTAANAQPVYLRDNAWKTLAEQGK